MTFNPAAAITAAVLLAAGYALYGPKKGKSGADDLHNEEEDESGEDVFNVYAPKAAEYQLLQFLNSVGNVQAYGMSESDPNLLHIVWKGPADLLDGAPHVTEWEEA